MITVIRSEDYDWIAVYKDGKLLEQGHSIQEEELIKLLGFEMDHQVWNEEQWEEHGFRCPEVLGG